MNKLCLMLPILFSGCSFLQEFDDLKVNQVTYKNDDNFEIIFSSTKDYRDRQTMGGASYIFCKPKSMLNNPRSLDPESSKDSISIYILTDDLVTKQGATYIYQSKFMVNGKVDIEKNGSKYLCQRFTGAMWRPLIKSEIFEVDIS